jgi:hypothetical protein
MLLHHSENTIGGRKELVAEHMKLKEEEYRLRSLLQENQTRQDAIRDALYNPIHQIDEKGSHA